MHVMSWSILPGKEKDVKHDIMYIMRLLGVRRPHRDLLSAIARRQKGWCNNSGAVAGQSRQLAYARERHRGAAFAKFLSLRARQSN